MEKLEKKVQNSMTNSEARPTKGKGGSFTAPCSARLLEKALLGHPEDQQIIMVATRHGFGHLVEQLGLSGLFRLGRRAISFRTRPFPEHHRSAPALRPRSNISGPSFIKLGQVMARRPDLLPLYAQELCKLTDAVPPPSCRT
jgi:hypothetical protein